MNTQTNKGGGKNKPRLPISKLRKSLASNLKGKGFLKSIVKGDKPLQNKKKLSKRRKQAIDKLIKRLRSKTQN